MKNLLLLCIACWAIFGIYLYMNQEAIYAAWAYLQNTPKGEITTAKATQAKFVTLPLAILFLLAGTFTANLLERLIKQRR